MRAGRCTRSTIANRRLKIENEIWARLDSNQGPRDYESPALPLSYRPVCILGIRTQSTARDQRDIWANFRGGHATINFQYFDSVKNYFSSRQATFRRSLDKFGALAMAGVSGPDSGGLKSRRESLA